MILKAQFEVRQMSLYGAGEKERLRIKEHAIQSAKDEVCRKIGGMMVFEEQPKGSFRFHSKIMASNYEKWEDFKRKIQQLVADHALVRMSLQIDIANAFHQFENGE